MGDTKGGPFDVPGDLARDWLRLPSNPNGRTNADVLRPCVNGMDVTRRSAGKWIVDFGRGMSEEDAALYEAPFQYALLHVMPQRQRSRASQKRWWRHERPRPDMWRAFQGLSRYIATPAVGKHRVFVWLDARICPDHALIVAAREDDTSFGILHSRFHEVWPYASAPGSAKAMTRGTRPPPHSRPFPSRMGCRLTCLPSTTPMILDQSP